jgi:hypothetical protein
MTETGRRPGRKAQHATLGKRVSLGLKVTPEIKNKLDEAAKDNGRTQSQEAEYRIEQTFRGSEYLSQAMELAYGARVAVFLTVLGRGLREIAARGGETAGDDWLGADPELSNDALGLIDEILASFGVRRSENPGHIGLTIGRILANALSNPDGSRLKSWAGPLNTKLGDAAARLSPAPMNVTVAKENLERNDSYTIRRELEGLR